MAKRFRIQISILVLIAAELFAIAATLAVFNRLESQQVRTVATVIGSLLRNESTMSQSYLLAQSLEDLNSLGVIRCGRLSRLDGNSTFKFYDSTFKSDCLESHLETVILPGIDGNEWELKVSPHIDFSFYVIKWTVLATMVLLLGGIYYLYRNAMRLERKKRETVESQRAFLEELAQQIRHDVASPMSALKVISERAPLDSDTKMFLREAVSRTEGIFETLKQLNNDKQSIRADVEIAKIVAEKKLINPNFPSTEINLSEISITASPIEFSRMISNLLNNAYEAGARSITVSMQKKSDQLEIMFFDDGKQIPNVVVKNIGNRGNTYGKAGGSGLGLYHAANVMRSAGGELRCSHESGAKITLTFPI